MVTEREWGRRYKYAYHQALQLTKGHTQLAEDIAQEAMLSLVRRPREVEDKTWKAFLRLVVHRRWVDYLRKPMNVREHPHGGMYNYEAPPVQQGGYDDRTKAALDALPPEMRECVMSVLVDGYTHQETAERLNLPLGTVLSRVYRGKHHLKRELEKTHAN